MAVTKKIRVKTDSSTWGADYLNIGADSEYVDIKFEDGNRQTLKEFAQQLRNSNDNKMNSRNPIGTGSLSLNRKADTIVGNYSVAEGYNTIATGGATHAEGDGTKTSGYAAHAEGQNTEAAGTNSHAEGNGTKASETYSHAEGSSTIASGVASHAEGQHSNATGAMSHAEGSSIASGNISHAEGTGIVASGDVQHAQGKYNISDTTSAHIVGNGTSTTTRSNAHTIDWSGNAWFSGDIYTGSTSGTNKDAGSKKMATEDYVSTKATEVTNSKITEMCRYKGSVNKYQYLPTGTDEAEETANVYFMGTYMAPEYPGDFKGSLRKMDIPKTLEAIKCNAKVTLTYKITFNSTPVTMVIQNQDFSAFAEGTSTGTMSYDEQFDCLNINLGSAYDGGIPEYGISDTFTSGDFVFKISANPVQVGDIYNVVESNKNYIWTGTGWDCITGDFVTIVTAITSTATDLTVPSTKSVYDIMKTHIIASTLEPIQSIDSE